MSAVHLGAAFFEAFRAYFLLRLGGRLISVEGVFGYFTKRRRRKLRERAFPEAWLKVMEERLPFYHLLEERDRKELQGHMQIFLAEKRFEGCGGQEIDDEVRIVIAGQACLLLIRRETDFYPDLHTILVYPEAYVAKSTRVMSNGVVVEEEGVRLGESWTSGTVVLAWSASKHGAYNPLDGRNVVFHEFAHQLDQVNGKVDGIPALGRGKSLQEKRAEYEDWVQTVKPVYEHLQKSEKDGRKSFLDYYGATNPAEFFAVATEHFFEQGKRMRREHPRLYSEMRDYFNQDPAEWMKEE